MIQLYTWSTPNGRKVSIALEELGLPYEVHAINIGRDEQFGADFLKVAPNNKIPAIVDEQAIGGPLSLFESGAILTYLAEKTGGCWRPPDTNASGRSNGCTGRSADSARCSAQLGFFAVRAPEKSPLAIERFTTEAGRLLGVMETRLAAHPYLAGQVYSMADIACYPWTLAATTFLKDVLKDQLVDKPSIHRWLKQVGDRPAVQRGMAVPTT